MTQFFLKLSYYGLNGVLVDFNVPSGRNPVTGLDMVGQIN